MAKTFGERRRWALRFVHAYLDAHEGRDEYRQVEPVPMITVSKYRPLMGVGPFWTDLRIVSQGRVVDWSRFEVPPVTITPAGLDHWVFS